MSNTYKLMILNTVSIYLVVILHNIGCIPLLWMVSIAWINAMILISAATFEFKILK